MLQRAPLLAAVFAWSWFVSPARAELKTRGKGKEQAMLREQFIPEAQRRYDIFKVKCTKCHPMARPIAALKTGITPVSGSPFNKESVKLYVVKMMRKPNSGIDRDEAREILMFLTYALELAQAEGPIEE
jgi:hypothetical protein